MSKFLRIMVLLGFFAICLVIAANSPVLLRFLILSGGLFVIARAILELRSGKRAIPSALTHCFFGLALASGGVGRLLRDVQPDLAQVLEWQYIGFFCVAAISAAINHVRSPNKNAVDVS